jgi:hypothetical protein
MPATIIDPAFASYLGGSIFTFAFPMLLFIIVAVTLYTMFSKTSEVPGHGDSTLTHTSGPPPTTVAVTDVETLPEGGAGLAPGEEA